MTDSELNEKQREVQQAQTALEQELVQTRARLRRSDEDAGTILFALALVFMLMCAFNWPRINVPSLEGCTHNCAMHSKKFFIGDDTKQRQLYIGCAMVDCKHSIAGKDEWDKEAKSWQSEMQKIVEALYKETK
jgi:hypothetical protein